MQPEAQSITHSTSEYELRSILKGSSLKIELLSLRNRPRIYSTEIKNQSMDVELRTIFGDVALMFECFRAPLVVALPGGIEEKEVGVRVKVNYEFRGKQVYREAQIRLEEVDVSIEEFLRKRINYLEAEVNKVKEDQVIGQQKTHRFIQTQVELVQQREKQLDIIAENAQKCKDEFERLGSIFESVRAVAIEGLNDVSQSLSTTKRMISEIGENLNQAKGKMLGEESIQMEEVSRVQPQSSYVVQRVSKQQQIPVEASVEAPHESHEFKTSSAVSKPVQLKAIQKNGSEAYTILGNKIIYTGRQDQSNQLVLQHKMRVLYNNRYRIRIEKTLQRHIYMGVVGIEHCKKASTNNVICIFGVDGEIWDGKPLGLADFSCKEGDIVEVRLMKGKIVWKVGNQAVEHYSGVFNIDNYKKVFLPFFEMRDYGDTIEWL